MVADSRRAWPVSEGGQGALEIALDAISGPALIVDFDGEVVNANGAARALLERDSTGIKSSLAEAVAGQSTKSRWELKPLGETALQLGFLALLRAPAGEGRMSDAVREANRLWKLTARQRQVLDLVALGYTNAIIAETLAVRSRTVEYHVSAIFDKAGVDNRATLIAKLMDL